MLGSTAGKKLKMMDFLQYIDIATSDDINVDDNAVDVQNVLPLYENLSLYLCQKQRSGDQILTSY